MTDATRHPPHATARQNVFDLIALPANHVLVAADGVTFSNRNQPVPEEVVLAASLLRLALQRYAAPEPRTDALSEAVRCGEQLSALGALVSTINAAREQHPESGHALAAVETALGDFLNASPFGGERPRAAASDDEQNPWHKAVLEACMVRESCYVPDDPSKTVRQLLQWEWDCALDPEVSAPAAAFVASRSKEPFYFRAINCPHSIDTQRVVLHYDPTQAGSNALAQLADRLSVPPGTLPDAKFWMTADPHLDGLSPAEVLHGSPFAGRGTLTDSQQAMLAMPGDERVALTSAVAERRRRRHPGKPTTESSLDTGQASCAVGASGHSEKNGHASDASSAEPRCHCHRCLKDVFEPGSLLPIPATRMIVCPICRNKRCPHASDHNLACSGSNESGQPGSVHQ